MVGGIGAGARAAVMGGGGGVPGMQWQDVFGSSSGSKKSEGKTGEVISISVEKSSTCHQLEGCVQQLFQKKEHRGLVIELVGNIKLGDKSYQLLAPSSPKRGRHRSQIYQYLCRPDNREQTMVTNAYQKFHFKLELPEDHVKPLPPCFWCTFASVEFKLVVLIKINENFKLLGEKVVHYSGQLSLSTIEPELHGTSIQKEICVGTITATIEVSKREYMADEEIPFTLKFHDKEKGSVKKISANFIQQISFDGKFDSNILDCVTYKRFLKREEFLRRGTFKASKALTASYFGSEGLNLKVIYAIQLQVITVEKNTVSGAIQVIICSDECGDTPSIRDVSDEDNNQEEPDASSPAPSSSGFLSASSMLSILPPSMNVPSRAGSLESLNESAPPNDE